MPNHYQLFPNTHSAASTAFYGLFVISGIIISLLFWRKASQKDEKLLLIYFSALGGAFLGAKLAYFAAEAWMFSGPGAWRHWLVGKSITGALLGGFLAVELAKKNLNHTKATGDKFALIIPIGVIIGRVGCINHGCCGGILLESGSIWPAPLVEICFNSLIWLTAFYMHRHNLAKNQLFHIYLVSYGIFRFLHEFMRSTPKVFYGISIYQVIAFLLIIIGSVAYFRRYKKQINQFPHNG